MGDGLCKGTIVGHQQQTLAVLIKAAHRIKAGGDVADKLHDGLAAQLIAGGGNIAAGLVQGQIIELLVLLDVDALVIHMQHIAVGVHLVAHLDRVAVHLDAALGNDLLRRAAGTQALLAHDLLNTFFCHSCSLLVRLPALKTHVATCSIKTAGWKSAVTAGAFPPPGRRELLFC